MTGLFALVKRNTKLYFKDKGMFISSLITPIILLVLYATFLKSIYVDSFQSALAKAGAVVPNALIEGCVGGQLVASLLAVSCVTVAFCSNLLMIKDKTSGARRDLTVTPVQGSTLGLSYYLAALASTLIIGLVTAVASFVYLAVVGWYLSALDVVLVLLDMLLLSLFGTAISSCVNFFLTTDGQASAVGTVVSAGYGFICGAYMPISSFGEGLQRVLGFLPGTYGTSLLRNHCLNGTFRAMEELHFPSEVIEAIRGSIDCNLFFFNTKVTAAAMYGVLCGSIAVLVLLYIAFNRVFFKK